MKSKVFDEFVKKKNVYKERITIKKYILEKGFNIKTLSEGSHINILKLIYLLYFPFARIKLTYALRISKALGININQLL